MGGIRSRLAPASLYMYAADFLRAAKLARSAHKWFRPAQPYLVCHALELGLRAFLSLGAESLNDAPRRSMGHDLGRLLAKAQSRGLGDLVQFNSAQIREIRKASLYYTRKVFEYPALAAALRGHPHKPNVDVLLAAAEGLLAAIKHPCVAQS